MTLTRRHAVLFFAIAVWNLLSYSNFVRTLWSSYAAGEDRPGAYYIAHVVLIVVNLAVAVVLGRLGWRAWKATGSGPRTPQRSTPSDHVPAA